MNKVILVGRLTRDPEIRGEGEKKTAKYTLAVDRFGKENGADFISCVAFGRRADHAEAFLQKGTKIVLEGRIQTGSYTKQDGTKVYTTDVVVTGTEFADTDSEELPFH